MHSVSAKFLDAIEFSYKTKTVIDVYYGTLSSPIKRDIPVSDVTIKMDRNSDSRVSGSMVVVDDSLLKTLEPWGTEIVIRSGVSYPNGTEELVPMGVFRIDSDGWEERPESIPTVEFYDRAQALIDTQTVQDQDLSGKFVKGEMSNKLSFSLPGLGATITFHPDLEDVKLPGGTIFSGNHWDFIKLGAEAMGGEAYFDRSGNLQVGLIPAVTEETVEADAVWTVNVGTGGVLISANRGVTRAETYNGIGMYGAANSDGARPFAQVFDTNPKSPTFYGGPFGRKTLRMENESLTTAAQCENAARQQLKNLAGLSRTVGFTSLANPALDVGDILNFEFFNDQEFHLLDSMDITLGTGSMSCGTRATQFVYV